MAGLHLEGHPNAVGPALLDGGGAVARLCPKHSGQSRAHSVSPGLEHLDERAEVKVEVCQVVAVQIVCASLRFWVAALDPLGRQNGLLLDIGRVLEQLKVRQLVHVLGIAFRARSVDAGGRPVMLGTRMRSTTPATTASMSMAARTRVSMSVRVTVGAYSRARRGHSPGRWAPTRVGGPA